jgi:membrane fusion protein, copper/silver efflux system
VYAPDLLAAQQEFIVALGSGDAALAGAARQRLQLLGLSAAQIAQVEKTRQAARRVSYYAPFDGYVMELGAREGAAVQPGTMLFQLAGLYSVWVNAELPEAQAAWIKPGDTAQVAVPALPGETFAASVDYLYPELDAATRTQKLRLVLRNAGQRLRPGMYASVRLAGAPRGGVLLVPSEAVIRTGTRSVVIVADDAGHFHPVRVRVGAEDQGRSEIVEGLGAGQQVVASGQFLIDSEANLRSALDSLGDAPEARMPMPGAGAGTGQ